MDFNFISNISFNILEKYKFLLENFDNYILIIILLLYILYMNLNDLYRIEMHYYRIRSNLNGSNRSEYIYDIRMLNCYYNSYIRIRNIPGLDEVRWNRENNFRSYWNYVNRRYYGNWLFDSRYINSVRLFLIAHEPILY